MKTLAATTLALPRVFIGSENKGRFRPAICAYSFRNQLKAGTMTYADLIRMAADLGADGIDMTAYWLADTSDQTLFPLKKLAYRSSIAIYTIGISASMAQPTPELQAAEVAKVRKWLGAAEKLGAACEIFSRRFSIRRLVSASNRSGSPLGTLPVLRTSSSRA